jgi:predicted nucleotidyltransferase
MQPTKKILSQLIKFRSLMNISLSKEKIKYIWGKKFLKSLDEKTLNILEEEENRNIQKKIKIAEDNISKLKVFRWVQFIGISGSVAAGFAKEEDDIDIFIVVKDGTMWIYRAMVVFRNLFHNRIRAKRHKVVKNKLCLNLICEERGLEFDNDIFNFHELMFLIPIYKKEYIKNIYSENKWLIKDYGVKKELLRTRILAKKKAILPIRVINKCAFLAQLLFMKIAKHNPETKRLTENFKKGRIEFFEYNYREKILKNYSKEFKSIS